MLHGVRSVNGGNEKDAFQHGMLGRTKQNWNGFEPSGWNLINVFVLLPGTSIYIKNSDVVSTQMRKGH